MPSGLKPTTVTTGRRGEGDPGSSPACGWPARCCGLLTAAAIAAALLFLPILREDSSKATESSPPPAAPGASAAASEPAPAPAGGLAAAAAGQPASPEVQDLLASLGLVEYAALLPAKGLLSLQRIARQREDRGPAEVRQFHWRRIVKEAKERLQAKDTLLNLDKDDETPAPPQTAGAPGAKPVQKEAKEDDDVELQPRSRTMGECHVTREFLPVELNVTPPIFWSFPGSGNTWIRFLIEQSTGVYTGSVYQDLDIIKLMPGEMRCDKSVVAVKGHPNWTPFDLVDGAYRPGRRYWVNGTSASDPIGSGRMDTDMWHGITGVPKYPVIKGYMKKCQVDIDRALVVTRDPYAALWAEYQRVKSEKVVGGVKVDFGHVAKLLKPDFDPVDMRKHLISLTQDWMLQFEGYEGFIERHGCESVLFQPFEEMVKKETRDFAITRMVSFLKRPMVTSPECAFRLADHPKIRRVKSKDPNAMTMADAFNDPRVGDLVCDMWEIAGREMEVLGYKPPPLGPRKGKCLPPRRDWPVISKHAVLTSGTVNCKSDRPEGLSGVNYYLLPDVYENDTESLKMKTTTRFNDCSDCPTKTKDQPAARKPKPAAENVTEEVFGSARRPPPYITFAVTGRNDQHSGNALERLQNQLVNVISYANRYQIQTEIIVVEWNPDGNRKNLASSLNYPEMLGTGEYVLVRVVTVSARLHLVAVEPPTHLPVQQYVGKNVALRRAHGEIVVCWNGDMLLTGAFWERLKRKDFRRGVYYRIDRLDLEKPLPQEFDVGNIEKDREWGWVQLHTYKIRAALGTRKLTTVAEKAQYWYDFYHHNDSTGKFADRCCASGCELQFKSCRWMQWRSWSGDKIRAEVPKLLAKGDMKAIEDILNVPQQFHANAPGDFLMMYRDDWFRIRGYPEAPYQDEMDKYPMIEAFSLGMDQETMAPPVASIHQYHEGSWGSGGAGKAGLTEDMAKRPSLGPRKYMDDGRDMLIRRKPCTLWADPTELGCNNKDWGFGNVALHEMWLVPQALNSTRTAVRVVREPHDVLRKATPPGCGWKYKAGVSPR
eukprot:TRINITY_DN23004_c0_g1_i1.p1 TRINITY_DN23004_c0_g1~~TRINITY_DN23004_c0_g1_i1.p1  ORF type:complete len:1051 (+),score=335.27 TRINITY_DN23004_c0_g1_i1:92-3244(+)